MNAPELEYVGFWLRFLAFLIDSALVSLLLVPVLGFVFGGIWGGTAVQDGPLYYVVNLVAPAIAIVIFWIGRQATPGKMAISARVVDARTGGKPTAGQLMIRYLGYYVGIFTLGIGFFMIGIDPRKQGLHDKMAGTVVVRPKRGGKQQVPFQGT